MSDSAEDIQSTFLRVLVDEQTPVWVFLVNGVKLAGAVTLFDRYMICLRLHTGIQTIFKSAVSTVVTQHDISAKPPDIERTRYAERRPRYYRH
ncbi:RNA chaperone Hfq [Caballeronia novacaledonica]|uniref:RNA-binding protein Hfq n=1 Tax=Caballeronia novacaledonica TaxID=1544861 RepID=A0AA37IJF3_9BURK|nr:RNA chaperone Hfq [Caballeronia novacaledonica]GJH30382.1 RNA-binding protein Hfq [Caballeronia novacaledonica]